MRSSTILGIVRKAGPSVTDTAACRNLRKIYGHSFPAGQSPHTLYELLEMSGSHTVSDLHVAMLQQDYDDGLLERKVKKVLCRK
jgi:hypothetical protein